LGVDGAAKLVQVGHAFESLFPLKNPSGGVGANPIAKTVPQRQKIGGILHGYIHPVSVTGFQLTHEVGDTVNELRRLGRLFPPYVGGAAATTASKHFMFHHDLQTNGHELHLL
jgi:hypothetical protein